MDPDSISLADSPSEGSSKPQNGPSKAVESAHDRIMAILDGSDDEDDVGESWKPTIPSISSNPQQERGKETARISYDIDLDDEDPAVTRISSGSQSSNTAVEDDDDGSAAYARLMKSFYSKPATKPTEAVEDIAPKPAPEASASQHSETSDDDMPVRKNKATFRSAVRSSPSRPSSPRLSRASRDSSTDLFVSPARRASPITSPRAGGDSESDEMPSTVANSRLMALVAKRRAEREAKEEAERKKVQAARREEMQKQKHLAKQFKEIYSSEMDDGMTEDAQKSLTENSRPAQRKASKKALEEMNRETQRIARNQQLTHQARVKRKFTTLDFVKSFGFPVDAIPKSDNRPQTRGALSSSDNEGDVAKDTPPSSPPTLGDMHDKTQNSFEAAEHEDEYVITTEIDDASDERELPDLNTLLSNPVPRDDKGKGKAPASSSPERSDQGYDQTKATRKPIRVVPPPRVEDSDDDLEIVSCKKSTRFAVFDNLPEKKAHEPTSLLNLRALAHMGPPPPKDQRQGRHSMTQAELRMRLAKEMQKQTVAEKQERLEVLRARGIVFKTEEEMEEDQLYIENMLEKARREAMELGRKENEAARKEGKDIDENYALPSDDESEDGNFEEEEEDDDGADVEMSGSEDEGADEDDEEESAPTSKGLLDNIAEEADEDEDAEGEAGKEYEDALIEDAVLDADEAITSPARAKSHPRARNRNVILDDDDEDGPEKPPTPAAVSRAQSQTSPINAFGFAVPNADMSLTQMFKGTMADLATQGGTSQATPDAQSLDFLRDAPAPMLLNMSPAIPPVGLLVEDSQSNIATLAKQQRTTEATPRFTQQFSAPTAVGSQMSPTKLSEIPEPTQDAGFESFRASVGDTPFSTVETLLMPMPESPIAQKKGKLRRRAQQVAQLSDDEATESDNEASDKDGEFELTTNAFDALFKAKKKQEASETFDKKRSEAKNIVEEQAEESEDEYAGLGGASDDESENGVDEEVQKMIDEGPVDVKEAELAKFFADKDRADDEKRGDKLYRDITTGALRRKRGVGVDDLSDDSDDEAAERRRQKQREFAKMRKALLEDENIGKIAENPKKLAFLRAIEDRDESDGIDYLGDMEDSNGITDSHPDGTQDEQQPFPAVQDNPAGATANMSLKRKLPTDFTVLALGNENIVPNMSHRRRAAANDGMTAKRPTTIAEIRESLSFLIDEPLISDSQISDNSDDDDDGNYDAEEDEVNNGPLRRVRQKRNDGNGSAVLTTVRASIINRLTVSRNNSMSIDEDGVSSGPMAFHTTNSASGGGFKVPNLLRRATANLSTSNSSSGTTTPTTNENAVRMGGSKRSNIHFQAREAERMKKVQEVERRRREGIRKSVVRKGRMSVLGNSLAGRNSGFE